jgi:FkbM family methyltransferase
MGSNVGAHTLHLARLVGKAGAVYAFEPQRVIFQLLCANVALNELFNVRTYHGALGRERGTIRVPPLDYSAEDNFGGLSLRTSGPGEDVPLWKMDGIAFPKFQMLKIDVEGMEAEVLSGARETIVKYRPVLYVENDRKDHSEDLIRLIDELGYDMWWHLPRLYNPNNFEKNPNNVFGGLLSSNLLCLPKERAEKLPHFRKVSGPGDWWKTA